MTAEDTSATLRAENARLCAEVVAAHATIATVSAQVATLLERVKDLEGQRAMTSRTSNKPPSSDGPVCVPRSPRGKSGKKPGGQPEHLGAPAAGGRARSRHRAASIGVPRVREAAHGRARDRHGAATGGGGPADDGVSGLVLPIIGSYTACKTPTSRVVLQLAYGAALTRRVRPPTTKPTAAMRPPRAPVFAHCGGVARTGAMLMSASDVSVGIRRRSLRSR